MSEVVKKDEQIELLTVRHVAAFLSLFAIVTTLNLNMFFGNSHRCLVLKLNWKLQKNHFQP
jgi:hypothetical protein